MKLKSTVAYAWQKVEQPMHTLTIKALAICLGMSVVFGSGVAPVKELMVQEVYAATQFADDAQIKDYSREPIESLVSIGSIKGYPEDNTFRPSGTISRIEFLSMAANAADPSGQARAKVIQEMKHDMIGNVSVYDDDRQGIVDDINDVWGGKAEELLMIAPTIGAGSYFSEVDKVNGRSGWLAPITRAESARMVVACLEKLGGEKLEIKDNVESIISDWGESHSDKALSTDTRYDTVASCPQNQDIKKLYSVGIATGDENGNYLPQYTLKRCDAAVLIYKAINKDKRATVNVAPKPEAPKPANTMLNVNDANRRDAIAGDKFVASDGKTYDVKPGVGGVLGEGLPIALDLNRALTKVNDTVHDRRSSDGTVGRLGDRYYINPETGEGHWRDDWQEIEVGYAVAQPAGKQGDTVYVGFGGWLKMTYMDNVGWVTYDPDWM